MKRYDAMVTAMEQLHMEPVVIENPVKFGVNWVCRVWMMLLWEW
jgi:hypothetical protein